MCSSRYAAAPSSCERASSARSRSTPCSRSASGSAAPSLSWRCRSSSWSAIEPAAADEPNSERPKRAPSSSAQLTSRTVTGGEPSAAMRRSTSTPAITFRQPSSQPPFGTESMCPPISTARSEAPRSVNHWLPAASMASSAPVSLTFPRSHSRARSHVSVQATRCAPLSSPVSCWSSRSSATVRPGSRGMRASLTRSRRIGPPSLQVVDRLGQLEDLIRELDQFPVLRILFLDGHPLLVGDDLPLGICSVLADEDEGREEDRLEGHDHRQQPVGVALDAEADPAREPDDVEVDEPHRAGKGRDAVGDSVLQALRPLLRVLHERRIRVERKV